MEREKSTKYNKQKTIRLFVKYNKIMTKVHLQKLQILYIRVI